MNLNINLNKKLLFNREKMTIDEVNYINKIMTEEFIEKLRDVLQGVHINSVVKIPVLRYAIYHLIIKNVNDNDDTDKIITLLKFIVHTVVEMYFCNDEDITDGEINEIIDSSVLLLKTNFMKPKERRCWFF